MMTPRPAKSGARRPVLIDSNVIKNPFPIGHGSSAALVQARYVGNLDRGLSPIAAENYSLLLEGASSRRLENQATPDAAADRHYDADGGKQLGDPRGFSRALPVAAA